MKTEIQIDHDLPVCEQPQARFESIGAQTLSDADMFGAVRNAPDWRWPAT